MINSVKDTENKSFRFLPEKELNGWKIRCSVGFKSHHKNTKNQLFGLRVADFFCLKKSYFPAYICVLNRKIPIKLSVGLSFIAFSTAELPLLALLWSILQLLKKKASGCRGLHQQALTVAVKVTRVMQYFCRIIFSI